MTRTYARVKCPHCPVIKSAPRWSTAVRDCDKHIADHHPHVVVAACDVPRPATTSLPPEPPVGGQATKPERTQQ